VDRCSLTISFVDSPVYRIFGNLKFVTDLGVLGVLSPKIASVFVHLVRISRYRAYVLHFFAKY